jgi:CheY-like chemotaxis protein
MTMQNKNNKYDKLMQKFYQKQLTFDKVQGHLDHVVNQYQNVLEENTVYQKTLFDLKEQLYNLQQLENRNAEQLNNELKKLNNKYQSALRAIKTYEGKLKEAEYLIEFIKNKNKETENINTGPKSILGVDDSAVIRAKMKKIFTDAGYNITLAKDGDEAMALLPQQKFDLIITDFEMPGASGLDVIMKARQTETNNHTPLILITSHDEVKIIIGDSENIAGVYRKPWKDADLLKKVKNLFALNVN